MYSLLRYLLFIFVTFVVISFISYHIFMREPLNHQLYSPYFGSQYLNYIASLLRGDFGISYNTGESISEKILSALPTTLELCLIAMSFAILLGIPLGFISAFYQDRWIGKGINAISYVGLSLPVFWIAPMLLYFAATFGWAVSSVGQYNLLYKIDTITGFSIIDVWFVNNEYKAQAIANVLQHLAMPIIILTISPAMDIIILIKNRTEQVLSQNYVRVAEMRGWSKMKILRFHVLGNTIPAMLPFIIRTFFLIFTYCMIVENIFNWPGIGRLIIQALAQEDYNVIAAGIIVIGVFLVLTNTIVKMGVWILDPFGRKGWYD